MIQNDEPKELFKWVIEWLDDQPTGNLDWLKEIADLDIITAPSELTHMPRAHIALIDMIWNNFKPDEISPPSSWPVLPKQVVSRTRFIKDWIRALQCAHKWEAKWLAKSIQEEEIGLWLAAMISHTDPDCSVVLYSQSSEEISQQNHMAPWLAFLQPPLRRLHKFSIDGLQREALLPAFQDQQKLLLNRYPKIRKWGQVVWLQAVLEQSATAQTFRVEIREELVDRMFEPAVLFPQINWSKDKAADDIRGIVFDDSLRDMSLGSLHQVSHLLRRDEYKDKAADLEIALIPLGQWGRTPLALLQAKRPDWGLINRSVYSLFDGLPYIKSTCDSACSLPDYRTEFPERPPQCQFPFPLATADWDQVRTALRSNPGGPGFLKAILIDDKRTLEITFFDTVGFASLESMRQAVAKSLADKGPDRGLPFVLLFAERYNASSVEVCCSGTWINICSGLSSAPCESPEGHTGGLRMRFPLFERGKCR